MKPRQAKEQTNIRRCHAREKLRNKDKYTCHSLMLRYAQDPLDSFPVASQLPICYGLAAGSYGETDVMEFDQ